MDRRPGRREAATPGAVRAVLGLSVTTIAVAIAPFLVGALATRIGPDLGLTTYQLGWAMAGYYLTSGLLSPLAGRVVERLGTTRSLRLAGVGAVVGLVAISQAPSTLTVLVLLTLLGAPNAMAQPACNSYLARFDHPRVRALSFGVLQASIPTATLLAALGLGVAGSGVDWRWTVLAAGLLAVVAPFLVPAAPPATLHRSETVVAATGAPRPERGPFFVLVLVLSGFCFSAALTTIPSFASTTGAHLGLAAWTIATAQTLGSAGSAGMRILAAALSSGGSVRHHLHVITALQSVGVLGFLGLASGTHTGFVVGTVVAFSFGWGFNGVYNLVVASARPDGIARLTGFTQLGIFTGGAAGPLAFALVSERTDMQTAWVVMTAVMTVAALGSALLARAERRRPGTSPQTDAVLAPVAQTCTPTH